MTLIKGYRVCPNCDEEYGWEYDIATHLESRSLPEVYSPNPNACYAIRTNSRYSDTVELKTRCKYCGQFEHFTYDSNSDNDE